MMDLIYLAYSKARREYVKEVGSLYSVASPLRLDRLIVGNISRGVAENIAVSKDRMGYSCSTICSNARR